MTLTYIFLLPYMLVSMLSSAF